MLRPQLLSDGLNGPYSNWVDHEKACPEHEMGIGYEDGGRIVPGHVSH